MTKKAMILLTSADRMGPGGKPTGFYWEELATPYWTFIDAGFDVEIVSVQGGEPPADPGSTDPENRPVAVQRFMDDAAAMARLHNTRAVADVAADEVDVLFLPGGHGTMWDLAQTAAVGKAVAAAYEAGAVVGAVCHGPAGLVGAVLSDGKPLVDGKRVNSFTDAEERAVGLTDTVPFLLESRLRELGGKFESNPALFNAHAVRDGRLVTGQNPRSSQQVADLMLKASVEAGQAA